MNTLLRQILVTALLPTALAGCYVVPIAPDGAPVYPYPYSYPNPYPAGYPGAAPAAPSGAPAPTVLSARLYPANELAVPTGVLSGTVTSFLNGKGRFQLQYKGETLLGEATRVDGDQKRGVANAYGSGGTYMSCEYQMQSPRQGVGSCSMSGGAKYQVHIGQ